MNKEEIKELARQSMLETIKTDLDSAIIFIYIKSLEDRIQKAIEYIEHEWFKREQIGIAPLDFSYEELQELLDILRGNDETI